MALDLTPWRAKLNPDAQRQIDEMAAELCRQSANMAAAEYRWLRLLGEYDARGGWGLAGARSCAAWLSWACGVSLPAARERVRVARALPELPAVCASFAAGRLSYSKVRAITRVATADNEELLVTFGESATAAQLETVVRGYRRSCRAEEARDAVEQFDRRSVRWWTDDEGFMRISARLPVDEGALVVGQIERTMNDEDEEDDNADDAPSDDGANGDRASADVVSDDAVDQDQTAAADGGDMPDANPSSSTGNVSAETPRSREEEATTAAESGDGPVVLSKWDASDPIERRRANALVTMAQLAAAARPASSIDGETATVVTHATLDDLRSHTTPDACGGGRADPETTVAPMIEGMGPIASETARRLACDASVALMVEDALGRPLGIGRQSQKIPRWLRRALKKRDRGRCQFPGCTTTRFLDGHHIVHWADDGPTDLENLVLICRFHHRMVHEVGYGIRVDGPGRFTFIRPDGDLVPSAPPTVDGDGLAVEDANTQLGLAITDLTGIPDWDGKPPDYSAAIEVLERVSAGTAVMAERG